MLSENLSMSRSTVMCILCEYSQSDAPGSFLEYTRPLTILDPSLFYLTFLVLGECSNVLSHFAGDIYFFASRNGQESGMVKRPIRLPHGSVELVFVEICDICLHLLRGFMKFRYIH
jgi:hypothetical protein